MFGWNSGSYKYLELALTIRFIAVVHVTCHAMGPVCCLAPLPRIHWVWHSGRGRRPGIYRLYILRHHTDHREK